MKLLRILVYTLNSCLILVVSISVVDRFLYDGPSGYNKKKQSLPRQMTTEKKHFRQSLEKRCFYLITKAIHPTGI